MNMPNIVINFIKNAQTIRQRSQRGIVCLILKDATSGGSTVTKLTSETEINTAHWTALNQTVIKLAFIGNPKAVYCVRYSGDSATFDTVKSELPAIPFNWIACPSVQADQALCAAWLKAYNSENPNHCRKAVLFNTTADDMHIVNFNQSALVFKDTTTYANITPLLYVSRIAGILAGLPLDRSATYSVIDELASVTEPTNKETALGNGEFFLFNDESDVRIGRAVNSLTTLGTNYIEAQKKIAVVEAMDLIKSDIGNEFKNNFVGKYKNNASNQALFVSFVNQYFDELANSGVLNAELTNIAEIDVAAQRQALIDAGYQAAEWDEQTVKSHTVGSNVYLTGTVAILDAIEDLTFNITME